MLNQARVSWQLYVAQAWWGYVTAADHQRLERLEAETVRIAYLCERDATMERQVSNTEDHFFKAIKWSQDYEGVQ